MTKTADFLFELGVAEIPALLLTKLTNQVTENFTNNIKAQDVGFKEIRAYSTPRRIAIYVEGMDLTIKEKIAIRKGPSLKAAYDADNNPTKACLGFAKSLGINVNDLIIDEDKKCVVYNEKLSSRPTETILAELITNAFSSITSIKGMRWGENEDEFIRPVYWIVALLNKTIIPVTMYGINSGNISQGHRFHGEKAIKITSANKYLQLMRSNYVIADSDERKQIITEGIKKVTKEKSCHCRQDDKLFDEVNGLVEYPVVMYGAFDKRFLELPKEVLETTIKYHQKCFPLQDDNDKSFPGFILVSNIQPRSQTKVIFGNEQVTKARLSDAEFFYQTDQDKSLDYFMKFLKNIQVHAKLGNVYEQCERLSNLTPELLVDKNLISDAKRAGTLSKFDLSTDMVGEFPELQGVMGYYYALHFKEAKNIATALKEQYMPIKLDGELPKTDLGTSLALAYRLDHLVGYFGINIKPKGDKDPFALRRAALNIVRIISNAKLDVSLRDILTIAANNYQVVFENQNCIAEVLDYILDRLKVIYVERGTSSDIVDSVLALKLDNIQEIDSRITAVTAFMTQDEAKSLAISNKRVRRILLKAKHGNDFSVNQSLLKEDVEKSLFKSIEEIREKTKPLLQARNYQDILQECAKLKTIVDEFFEKIMVMDEDHNIRTNRLNLLANLQGLFLQVADISLINAEI